MSEAINPYAPPTTAITSFERDALRTGAILSRAWLIYRKRFSLIALTVMIVWVPCELLISYMDAFVFDENDIRRSFKFAELVGNVFGVIATAGVIHVALQYSKGTPVGVGQALAAGLRNWFRIWWTQFLSTLFLLLSFLLLILPFFYLAPRLALVDNAVVCESLSGTAAMRRSEELVQGHYWQMAGILCLQLLMACLPILFYVGLALFEIEIPNWTLEAGVAIVFDIIAAFSAVWLYCAYDAFSQKGSAEVSPSAA